MDISFSTDGGSTFGNTISETLAQGPNSEPYRGETITFSAEQTADFVRFDVVSNYGDPDLVQFAEVRFTQVPEPATYALIGGFLALGAAMLRRRRNS